MSAQLFFEQCLNGIQLGVMLFLLSSGLTLVLGIMNVLNLTHSALYTVGAYVMAAGYLHFGSFVAAALATVAAVALLGLVIERVVMSRLYSRDHLDQVLATFGLLLFINEMTIIVWGRSPQHVDPPELLAGTVPLFFGIEYPVYRLAVTGIGLLIALGMYLVIQKTRFGMLVRAGATSRVVLGGMGINVKRLFTAVFCIGAVLAGVAGIMVAPLVSIDSGMGDAILTLCFVVIVIGGLGSVRGAFIGALMVGLVDTFGRTLLPMHFGFPLGPALASMLIYVFMAGVLLLKPEGLFPVRR